MKKIYKDILQTTGLVLALSAIMALRHADAAPIGIASGNKTGTNYPMIEDIKAVCSKPDAPITNVVTNGSQENIFRIYEDKSTQYSIVQADAAAWQQGLDPKMMERIVMIFPFFSVEFHLVAKDGSAIKSLADLAGKNVVEGPEGSGTWVTVQMIKKLTGIKWNAINASQQDGYNMVLNGQADAEFIIAGKPINLLKTAAGVKLISISHPRLDAFPMYTKTQIYADGSYGFQKGAVNTYKVDNFLATYAFKQQYQKEIGDLVTCITRNIDTLQVNSNGKFHPKWKDVNVLDIDRINWTAHPAAVAAIKREITRK